MRTGYRCVLMGALLAATCGFSAVSRASYPFQDMTGADLSRRRLPGANLSSADLQSADLRSCDLRRADLTNACLVNADLRGADLRGADLTCANLSDANLRGARLDDVQFGGAMYSLDTRWPGGFTPRRRPAQTHLRGPGARYLVFPHLRARRTGSTPPAGGRRISARPYSGPAPGAGTARPPAPAAWLPR